MSGASFSWLRNDTEIRAADRKRFADRLDSSDFA